MKRKRKDFHTKGVRTPIISAILTNAPGPRISSSARFLPMVKLRNLSSRMFGLSAE